ncbi:MAG: HAD family hydrolase [Streptosporangiaceae bacterium]
MTWVLFDYGRVVSTLQPDSDLAALAAAAGAAVAELLEPYWRWRLDYDLAELDPPAYWRQVGTVVGRDYSDAEIADLVELDSRSWLHLAAGTVALVEELADAGHRLALLSNAPVPVAEAVVRLPVAKRFEHLLFSCYLRAAKPDPRCYAATLDRLGARPAEVIFIDDRPDNVAAAAATGIRAVPFSSPEQARRDVLALLAAS